MVIKLLCERKDKKCMRQLVFKGSGPNGNVIKIQLLLHVHMCLTVYIIYYVTGHSWVDFPVTFYKGMP